MKRIFLMAFLFFSLSTACCEIPATKLINISQNEDGFTISSFSGSPIKAWSFAQYNNSSEINANSATFIEYTPYYKTYFRICSDKNPKIREGRPKYVINTTAATVGKYYVSVSDHYFGGILVQENVFVSSCKYVKGGSDFVFKMVNGKSNYSGNSTIYYIT